jgi:hypothetical protein
MGSDYEYIHCRNCNKPLDHVSSEECNYTCDNPIGYGYLAYKGTFCEECSYSAHKINNECPYKNKK